MKSEFNFETTQISKQFYKGEITRQYIICRKERSPYLQNVFSQNHVKFFFFLILTLPFI